MEVSQIVVALDHAWNEADAETDSILRRAEQVGIKCVALKLVNELGHTSPESLPLIEWMSHSSISPGGLDFRAGPA